MVRTYRAERNQNVLLLLDNGRVMAGQVADVPRVEHAMDARDVPHHRRHPPRRPVRAASPSTARCGRCSRLGPGRDQLGRVAEAMFDLEPELAESDYRGAFTQALARFRRRSLIVLFTDLVEQAVGESLLPGAARCSCATTSCSSPPCATPTSCGGRRQPPGDVGDAYRAAAATMALAERDRATARLRGLGAIVVDAPPASSPPASPTPTSTSRPAVVSSRRRSPAASSSELGSGLRPR